MGDPRDRQVGGDHYKKLSITPWSVIEAWGLNFWEGNALKYLSRDKKGSSRLEDLQKAQHYIEEAVRQEKKAEREKAAQVIRTARLIEDLKREVQSVPPIDYGAHPWRNSQTDREASRLLNEMPTVRLEAIRDWYEQPAGRQNPNLRMYSIYGGKSIASRPVSGWGWDTEEGDDLYFYLDRIKVDDGRSCYMAYVIRTAKYDNPFVFHPGHRRLFLWSASFVNGHRLYLDAGAD